MDEVDPVPGLHERFRRGDGGAAAELFARYADRLTRLAEQHLGRRLAARLDGADVVQSVWRTFFRRSRAGEFHIDSSTDLWRLLARITLLKARARGRHHTAACRDVRAEAGDDAALPAAPGREPDPADAAAVVDLIAAVLRGRPPLFADVLRMRLEGRKVTEVARRLRLSRGTVHVVLGQLRRRLEECLADGGP